MIVVVVPIGTVTGTNSKAVVIADYSSGIRQTVAVQIDPRNFMVTIASSFVLVTLRESATRHPVIHKTWKLVDQRKGEGVADFFGTVSHEWLMRFLEHRIATVSERKR